MEAQELFEQIQKEFDLNRMMKDAKALSKWARYSGSEDGEKAVDYILDQMAQAGVETTREQYDLYRSLPKAASVSLVDSPCLFRGMPAVYSGVCQGLIGELVYDHWSAEMACTPNINKERYASFKDKIVLTYDGTYSFYYEAARNGAKGIVGIWPGKVDHHDTMGGVWGNPGNRDRDLYPYIPYMQILQEPANVLLENLKKGKTMVRLEVDMDNSIVKSSMPIAKIPGKSEKYILVSGHYDSWYEGMTDNGAANIMMMELARVLKAHQNDLERSVVVAWWSGHSDGRYAGSGWYFDNHFEDLKENCVAHLNFDICGCKGANAVKLKMSGMEGKEFNDTFLAKYNKNAPRPYTFLDRNSDQSFWGSFTPIAVAPSFFVDNGEPVKPKTELVSTEFPMTGAWGADGPFFWWHTIYDTIDVLDPQVMFGNLIVAADLSCRYLQTYPLPLDLPGFMDEMKAYFKEFEQKLNPDFDVKPILPLIDQMDAAVKELVAEIPNHADTDEILKKVAGGLNFYKFTYSGTHEQDHAAEHDPYAAFSLACRLTRDNTPEDVYLFARTDFVRQRNRMAEGLKAILTDIKLQMLLWNNEKEA